MAGRKSIASGGGDDALVSRNRSSETELDITPMIDVTFLLLIFFMVTSTMQQDDPVNIPIAEYGIGVDSNKSMMILIKPPGAVHADAPSIHVGDAMTETTLEELNAYVDESVNQDMMNAIVKADREVPHGFVQEVLKVLASFEGVKFVIGVQDKKAQ